MGYVCFHNYFLSFRHGAIFRESKRYAKHYRINHIHDMIHALHDIMYSTHDIRQVLHDLNFFSYTSYQNSFASHTLLFATC